MIYSLIMRDLKYLSAFIIPITAFLGLWLQGYYTFIAPVYTFGLVPVLEQFSKKSTDNLDDKTRERKSKSKLFDWLLYSNIIVVYGLLFTTLYVVTASQFKTYELVGMLFSLGIVLGSNGINVGHELGHRLTNERFIGKALLLPSMYSHFYIEHNFGHHVKIATIEDPATAKYNQPVYFFWFTSVIGQYISAWKIQLNLLKRDHRSFFSFKNDMFWSFIIISIYLSLITFAFGIIGLKAAIISGVIGFLLLETINYIEHYGLQRKKKESGRYERPREIHSWNSNHTFGRIMLYELTRHSDHHHRASKKYQLLDHHDSSPQLPFGYPASMVLSLIPPIWFMIMNKRVPKGMKNLT